MSKALVKEFPSTGIPPEYQGVPQPAVQSMFLATSDDRLWGLVGFCTTSGERTLLRIPPDLMAVLAEHAARIAPGLKPHPSSGIVISSRQS